MENRWAVTCQKVFDNLSKVFRYYIIGFWKTDAGVLYNFSALKWRSESGMWYICSSPKKQNTPYPLLYTHTQNTTLPHIYIPHIYTPHIHLYITSTPIHSHPSLYTLKTTSYHTTIYGRFYGIKHNKNTPFQHHSNTTPQTPNNLKTMNNIHYIIHPYPSLIISTTISNKTENPTLYSVTILITNPNKHHINTKEFNLNNHKIKLSSQQHHQIIYIYTPQKISVTIIRNIQTTTK